MKAGWEIKTLGEVAEVIAGQSPEGKFYNDLGNGLPFYQGKKDFGEKFIGEPTTWTSKTTKTALENDLLMSVRAPVGALNFATQMCCIGRGLAAIRSKKNVDKDFIFYFLLCKEKEITGTEGAVFASINKDQIQNISIPIPPLPEQKRLVTILDEAFESIATAKANAEQNLKNARALFESHLNEVFTKRGEGWEVKPLSHFASTVSTGPFGSLLHKSDYVSEGVPLVNPINIVNGKIIPDENKLIDKSTKQRLQNYVLEKNDVVLGRRGEIGRCAVIDTEQAGWVCGTGCFFIRPLETINPYFLAGLIRSSGYREQLENASTGATMLNLSNKALSDLSISVPSISEQQNLLQKLDVIEEETQHLEALYSRKIAALDELKKALLHRAFSGEL